MRHGRLLLGGRDEQQMDRLLHDGARGDEDEGAVPQERRVEVGERARRDAGSEDPLQVRLHLLAIGVPAPPEGSSP